MPGHACVNGDCDQLLTAKSGGSRDAVGKSLCAVGHFRSSVSVKKVSQFPSAIDLLKRSAVTDRDINILAFNESFFSPESRDLVPGVIFVAACDLNRIVVIDLDDVIREAGDDRRIGIGLAAQILLCFEPIVT